MYESENKLLAKLLASENISVVVDNVSTASFNVRDRILTLPSWGELDAHVQAHLTGHEVGHALYTPEQGWHDAVCDSGRGYKSFLNVVEDARIEKLVQRKYPGLRGDFVKSYKKLFKDGLFGADIDTINKGGLIDRLNVYFKCGMTAGVKFTEDEKQWLPRIDKLETWDQVVTVTDELFEYCKKQKEEQEQEEQKKNDAEEEQEEQEQDESEDDYEPAGGENDAEQEESDEEEEEDSESGGGGDSDYEEDWEEDDEEESPANGFEGGTQGSDDPESLTDKNLRDAIQREMGSAVNSVYNFDLPVADTSKIFIGYKRVLANLEHDTPLNFDLSQLTGAQRQDYMHHADNEYNVKNRTKVAELGAQEYSAWYKEAKKSVSIMVKEFEMKKSASALSRARTSKTGVLDTLKMNDYRINDDIFKKVTSIPKGKNHGFIMVLDLSASMYSELYDVVKQTLLLTHFCRAIGVPFRVYGFTDNLSCEGISVYTTDNLGRTGAADMKKNSMYVDPRLRMIEIFNESMTKTDLLKMSKYLLGSASLMTSDRRWDHEWRGVSPSNVFSLGGTPLDASIIALMPVAIAFKKQYRLDKLNTIFLTDGQSHPAYVAVESEYKDADGEARLDRVRSYQFTRETNSLVTLRNEINNKVFKFRVRNNRMMSSTDILFAMYKDCTGSTMLGYYVVSGGRKNVINSMEWLSNGAAGYDEWDAIKAGGHACVPVYGYDEMYVVWSKNLKQKSSTMDAARGAGKGALTRAFGKTARGSRQTRSMLLDIVKHIA